MDVFDLVEKLKICYQARAPTVEDYLKLSEMKRDNLCMTQRKNLIDYVNSNQFTFYNIVHSLKKQAGI